MRGNTSLIWLVALAVVLACVPTIATPLPALDPGAVNTFIAQTAGAASTQTARALPSSSPSLTLTPTPRNTDTPSPTPTVTFVFILSTPTPLIAPTFTGLSSGSSNSNFACLVISVNPGNGTVFAPRTDFDAKWQVQNIGRREWDRNNIDYYYSSGAKLHKVSGYDLDGNVDPGTKTTLVVDMEAPKDPGTYTTVWKMRSGEREFCTLTLAIVVQ